MKEVAIIGGGILGLSIGYKLSRLSKDYKVTIFEKESEVGCHQSGRNSGVLHCGLSYEPNSLKAQLAVEGIREMIAFCKQNEVNFDQCGKIVVATTHIENKILQEIAIRGKSNGLKKLKFLNKNEINEREPNIIGFNALLVPEEGIVDYKGVMLKLIELIKSNEGEVFFNTEINNIVSKNNKSIINYKSNEKNFDLVINCAGLHSDRVFKNLSKTKRPIRIVPFRGEYMSFKDEYKEMVNHLVYPVPNPKFPFLGVHFTRMINGDREVGPNAVLALKREGYKNTDFSIRDSFDSLSYKGLHNFIKNNFNFALGEFSSSIFKKSFINKAKKMMPEIKSSMLKTGTSGVRAQGMSPKGELLMDFKIEKIDNQIHILNAPSPGATASLAIANYIINNFIEK
jgi:(S)-2-hydroxyglutarate dehydrogenase